MNGLHEWIANQDKRSCDLCGVSIMLNLVTLGLMAALHWGDS